MNPHSAPSPLPFELFASVWRNRYLIFQMTRRDVVGRYRGSFVGLSWSFVNPALMLAVYTFVFSGIFKARWRIAPNESATEFAIILFVGLIVYNLFAECISRAPSLILTNPNYVKKVIFPLEILPWIALGSALFHASVSLVALVAAQVLLDLRICWTAALLPIVVAPLLLITMGTSWFLAATGVFIRDIGQITGVLTTAMLFMAPVFYPLSSLPDAYQPWLFINPLTFVIEQARRVLILGLVPDWTGLALYSASALVIVCAGFWWFQKTRRGFADVI